MFICMYFVYIISVCVVKSKIYSHRKNISSNHLFNNFPSKNVAFTKILSYVWEWISEINTLSCIANCRHILRKNSRNCLIKYYCIVISRNIFHATQILVFLSLTQQCGKARNSLSPKNISSNQLYNNSFSKTVTFTKILPKMREREFP